MSGRVVAAGMATMGGVLSLLLLGMIAAAPCDADASFIKLKKRTVPIEEQQQILELLEVGEGQGAPSSSGSKPYAKLNSNFFGTIQIGAEKQEFEVVFDTGSSVLWVYSDKCESCKSEHKRMFNPHKSAHFHERDIPFSIRYGTGESKGTTGVDEVYIADLEVREQVFGQCEQPDSVMRGFPFDGIVGLSRALVKDPNAMPTIIKNIKEEHLLDSKDMANTFSFYIGREEGDETYLIFGAAHEMMEDTNAAMHYVGTLNKNIYWEVPLNDVLIHKKEPSEKRHSSHHHLEQSARITTHNDAFASLMADPEAALLQIDEEISLLETETNTTNAAARRKQHHSRHKHHKSSGSPHSLQSVDTLVRELEAEMERKESSGKQEKKNVKIKADKGKHHVYKQKVLEEGVSIKAASAGSDHRARKGAKNAAERQKVVESIQQQQQDDGVGTGQLFSHFKSPGQSINPCMQDNEHTCIISVDSGHSLMSGPPDVIRPLKQALMPANTDGGCTDEVIDSLPDVSFVIGGKMFTMTPTDYLIELSGKCVPAFSERTVRNGHDWVLGEHFMRTFYTVFDYDNMRVGFSHLDDVKPHIESILASSGGSN